MMYLLSIVVKSRIKNTVLLSKHACFQRYSYLEKDFLQYLKVQTQQGFWNNNAVFCVYSFLSCSCFQGAPSNNLPLFFMGSETFRSHFYILQDCLNVQHTLKKCLVHVWKRKHDTIRCIKIFSKCMFLSWCFIEVVWLLLIILLGAIEERNMLNLRSIKRHKSDPQQ